MSDTITITIQSSSVLEEIGRLTNYAGIKLEKDEGDFERIAASGNDGDMLKQFWQTACDTLTEAFKERMNSVTANGILYTVTLTPSKAFDNTLVASMTENMKSYVINYMTSRWFMLTNKEDAEAYGKEAEQQINEALRKWYYKVKPTRTRPTT